MTAGKSAGRLAELLAWGPAERLVRRLARRPAGGFSWIPPECLPCLPVGGPEEGPAGLPAWGSEDPARAEA